MAFKLSSPGVEVSIIDESFYGSSTNGTVPLIIMATAANKTAASGIGYAPYTTPANAGKLFLATSQRELIQNFGTPYFHSVQGTQLHGHELNEYGLHAAYQYLGVSNRAFVLRADIDLAQLEASSSAPRGTPVSGTYWFDVGETSWGVFRSNGNEVAGLAWESVTCRPALGSNVAEVTPGSGLYAPVAGFGVNGDFAAVVETGDNKIWEKVNGAWYALGTPAWKAAHPTTLQSNLNPAAVDVDSQFVINTVLVEVKGDGSITTIRQAINDAAIPNITASVSGGRLIIRNTAGGDITIDNRNLTPLTTLGFTAGTYRGVGVTRTANAQYPAGSKPGDVWIKGTSPNKGANWIVKYYDATAQQWFQLDTPFYSFNSVRNDGDPLKDVKANEALGTPATGSLYVAFDAATGVQMLRRFDGRQWTMLSYIADTAEPTEEPDEGTLWFNADFRVDMMVSDGDTWVGYKRRYTGTNPQGVFLTASQPTEQSDGSPLVTNDLWIDTSDLENYPKLSRYDALKRRWTLVDLTDKTSPFGIVFADARADSGTAFANMPPSPSYRFESEDIEDLLVCDYLDPDAPDPREYPAGTLLFNTRYSTYNVKSWRPRHFEDGQHDPNTDFRFTTYTVGDPNYVFNAVSSAGRWVTESGNKIDNSPYMGRKAQRVCVVKAMSAAVVATEDLRSELVYFNLMAAPGYPELMDELVTLNTQQKEVSFIVGDTPKRLSPAGIEVTKWAKNEKAAPNGEDGLSTNSVYSAVYYPWGLGTNIDGAEVMIPPSTIALCTMAYSDSVSYPWFAPAGFQRGVVSVATTVGYLDATGQFRPTLLNPGQRDNLYGNKINPIAFIPGRGLVVYGQKTLSPLSSALDRINVARLANYLKYNLDNLMKPYLFEQNDQQTRDSVKLTVTRFLAGLVTLRALEDFAVLCDETNNTPERRDQNQLWVDILIKPLKAIEFIYVPVRIRNSSDALMFAQG